MNTHSSSYTKALRQLRRSFVQAGLFSAVINLLMLTGPLYMLQIYDRVLASGSVPTLMGLFLIVVTLYGFLGLYEFIRSRILSRAAYRLDRQIGDIAFRQRLNTNGTGNSLRDLGVMRGFLAGPAARGLFDVPWMPIFLITVFLIHPLLGYLTLTGAAAVVVLAFLNQLFTRTPTSQAAGLDAQERAFTEQCQRSAETVRALGMQGAITARWQKMHNASQSPGQNSGDRSDGFAAVSRAFRMLLQSMLLTVGAYLALNQQISMGMIVGASILAGRALAPVDQVIAQWRSIGRAAEAHRRLKAEIDTVPARQERMALPEPKGAISLNGVSKLVSNAQPSQPRIIDQASFALEPGDGLCVIGNSAAGKSSLARLLVGIWAPDFGDVRLDGATLDQWDPDKLGRHIGYLPQNVEMLPGSVAENIARFDITAEGEKVYDAAVTAGVHEMILGLPQGYSTRIGLDGHPLSGGQLQRIGLARAIYAMPKLLVLDEPNAHLDAHGDEALVNTIAQMRDRGTTVVVMTHRPSLIASVNKVLILHQGRVAQFGPKEVIMRKATQSVPQPQEKPQSEASPQSALQPDAQPRAQPAARKKTIWVAKSVAAAQKAR